MNVHLLQHLAYYVSRRGPLWAYSCFAFESMNAFIKPLVHGTHHAMEQIGCAIGLCFGLSNFMKKFCKIMTFLRPAKRSYKVLPVILKVLTKCLPKYKGLLKWKRTKRH